MTHKEPTVLITGGHLSPAVATIEEIGRSHPGWNLVFVGRETALEGRDIPSEERDVITRLGVRFLPLRTGRLKREGGMSAIVSLAKIPAGFLRAYGIVSRVRPDVVVSFGGYVALPIAVAARLLNVPVVTHEQTLKPGLANRLIGRIAKKTAVSFPEAAGFFPGSPSVTGLPVRRAVTSPPKTPPFAFPRDLPILFIAGGSTGSVSINRVVFGALPELLGTFAVIHQTGRLSAEDAARVRDGLPAHVRNRYLPVTYLSSAEYSWALGQCSMIIGRSGANTVTEAAMEAVVGIWIPLPWAARAEQEANAEFLSRQGGSVILPQSGLTVPSLVRVIRDTYGSLPVKKSRARELANRMPRDGAVRFVRLISDAVRGDHS